MGAKTWTTAKNGTHRLGTTRTVLLIIDEIPAGTHRGAKALYRWEALKASMSGRKYQGTELLESLEAAKRAANDWRQGFNSKFESVPL